MLIVIFVNYLNITASDNAIERFINYIVLKELSWYLQTEVTGLYEYCLLEKASKISKPFFLLNF